VLGNANLTTDDPRFASTVHVQACPYRRAGTRAVSFDLSDGFLGAADGETGERTGLLCAERSDSVDKSIPILEVFGAAKTLGLGWAGVAFCALQAAWPRPAINLRRLMPVFPSLRHIVTA